MKFEQALKAMRRGEKVRRKCWTGPAWYKIVKGQIVISQAGFRADPHHDEVLADDWIIIRKKKKAPKPMFAEDQLEPVGTMPVVGDKIVAMRASTASSDWSGTVIRVGEIGGDSARTERGLIGPGCMKGDPDCNYYRILKRPTPSPRNIFKDPRVGDEFGNADCTWRVIGVGAGDVAFQCILAYGRPNGTIRIESGASFADFAKIYDYYQIPTEEEVGSPDAK